jgi:hypothetical protein
MIQHVRRAETKHRKWLVLVVLGAASVSTAGGPSVRSPRPPTEPATRTGGRETAARAFGADSRDAQAQALELMTLAAFEEPVGGGGGTRSSAPGIANLRGWQWNEDRGCSRSHPYFGGTGRWPESAPDLIHTALLLRALRGAGLAANDPYIQRAALFIARCQVVDDPRGRGDVDRRDRGGFSTGPVVESSAGIPTVRLGRPSGASTCVGLTSLLAAGVAPDDARVRGAVHWLEEHYSVDAHPGMARAREGLYGYYYEFARAMTALGRDRIRDSRGVPHDWRAELERELAERQHADGSWTNPDESPEPASRATSTVTSLALLTLRQLRP